MELTSSPPAGVRRERRNLGSVTLRGRVLRALRGSESDADPDEFIELLTVPMMSSQLLLHGLTDREIGARGQSTYNGVTRTADCRITVRRKDMPTALQALVELGFAD